jgi:hypothetical protein
LLVVITEGIPVQDSAYAWAYNRDKGNKTRIMVDRGDQPVGVRYRHGQRRVITQAEDAVDARLKVDADTGVGVGAECESVVNDRQPGADRAIWLLIRFRRNMSHPSAPLSSGQRESLMGVSGNDMAPWKTILKGVPARGFWHRQPTRR